MDDRNPYAELTAPPAAFAAVHERAAFLKKVYGLLFLGVLGFAATLWAAGNVPVVHDAAMSVGRLIYGHRWGWAIYLGVFLGGSFAVQAVAEKRPLNAFAYAAWVVVLGFLIAPLVLMINRAHGPEIITQASLLTAVVFGGLTAIVFYTSKDFSFLRGILMLVGGALLVTGIAGAIFGFSLGLWFSAAIVLLMAGYILYHTSAILHRLPTTMAMSGAIMLFTDVVLLFKHILILLARSRD
jgi:FtsH-binding integral membrane protein